jgi:hypothetical protein
MHIEAELAPRGLVSKAGVAALITTAGATLTALLPLAKEREHLASRVEASALSVDYLRIALNERPNDPDLRFNLAERELSAGNYGEARRLIAPMLTRADAIGKDARFRALNLEQRAYAAVTSKDPAVRRRALTRTQKALASVRSQELTDKELAELAKTAAALDAPVRRAELLLSLTERSPESFKAYAPEAEVALIQAGRIGDAAALVDRRAAREHDVRLAMHAIEMALAADAPDLTAGMVNRYERMFPKEHKLTERALQMALGRGDLRGAMQRAEKLMAAYPDDMQRRMLVRDIAGWAGDTVRATALQASLARAGVPGELQKARLMAEQRSDLPLLNELLTLEAQRGKASSTRLLARTKVLEALGAPQEALRLLDEATYGAFAGERAVWKRAVSIARALGDSVREDNLLHRMDRQFGYELPNAKRRAELAMRSGKRAKAGQELSKSEDAQSLLRAAEIAWEDDDIGLARVLYRQRTQLRDATDADFYRLSVLEGLTGDERSALRVAMAGLERFKTQSMYSLALGAALGATDRRVIASVVEASSDPEHVFHREPELVALRIVSRQQAAAEATRRGDHSRAHKLLAVAQHELTQARTDSALESGRLESLGRTQGAEEWNLAIASGDLKRVEALYPSVKPGLTPREDVFVLSLLGQKKQAFARSLTALKSKDLSADDRKQLVADAEGLKGNRVREARAGLEYTHMGPLDLPRGYATTAYDFDKYGLLAGASFTYLNPDDGKGLDTGNPYDVALQMGVHIPGDTSDTRVSVGVDTRNGSVVRPFAVARHQLKVGSADLALTAAINEVPTDTPALRMFGARDEVSVGGTVPIGEHLYASVMAQGTAYSTRNRDLLGTGITAEGAFGVKLGDASSPVNGNVRLFGRTAQRFRRDEDKLPDSVAEHLARMRASGAGPAVPDSTTWIGAGASVGKGDYTLPPLDHRKFAFLLDGSAGLLVPQKKLGVSGRAGVGMSVAGEDMLSVSGRVSNVMGNAAPGAASSTVWSVLAEYSVSLWK